MKARLQRYAERVAALEVLNTNLASGDGDGEDDAGDGEDANNGDSKC